jgi:hypothetical protein
VRARPAFALSVIRHEPDNSFLECALPASAEFIVTVNTAPEHNDRKGRQGFASPMCARDPRRALPRRGICRGDEL